MQARALVEEGRSRADAARLCGMDRQTLRGWVHRCNEADLAGLADKQACTGPQPRVTAERTVGSVLHKLGFSHLSARPGPPNGDAAAQGFFRLRSAPS